MIVDCINYICYDTLYMLHGFFFGFTRNLSIFKAKTAKTRKRKLFAGQIQAGAFFLFQAVIGLWHVLYKN